jgi:hypothetical protein
MSTKGFGARIGLTALLVVCAVACTSTGSSGSTASTNSACPTRPGPSDLASVAALRSMSAFVAKLGARPTGSAAQQRYVDWIEQQLQQIDGVTISEKRFTIDRWSPTSASLALRVGATWKDLPVAAPIHYAHATAKGGVTAPLVAIPDDEPITDANAKGRIVVRPAPAGSVPQSVFTLPLVTWSTYDPHHTIDPKGTFVGDFLDYKARVADLAAAATAGAAGIVFVKDLPRAQVAGHVEPYEGVVSPTPGVWLGADEGKVLTDALAAGGAPVARLTLDATVSPATTRSVFATIPGKSDARLVVDSHTDGTNAVEDNGPVAMIAMARYFAALPERCRPRTIELSFSTAHFYQRLVGPTIRNGGAEWLARKLDAEYDKGTVAGVLVLEHLGSREYESRRRAQGPGSELVRTPRRTIQQIFVTPSKALVSTVESVVKRHDLERTVIMKGAGAPGDTAPRHCNFGGEGTPFDQRLLPTIGVISAPQSLYDPAFGMEGVDVAYLRDQVVAFTELVLDVGRLSDAAIAGSVPAERARRAAGAPECPT